LKDSTTASGQMLFMPGYIYQQAIALQNWPFAAAMSVIFLVAIAAAKGQFCRAMACW
jgi:putative spermidine/putrescine transport system permease protein